MTAASKRRLFTALALSLLLHVLVLSGVWMEIPQPVFPVTQPLQARLVSAPPPITPPAPPVKPQRKIRHHAPRRAAPPAPAAAPLLPETTAASPFTLPPPAVAAPFAGSAASPAMPAAPATPAAPAAKPVAAVARNLPKKGRITYDLFLGSDKFSVGTTTQSWDIEAGTYKLGSISETTGLADLFASQHLNYLSEGRITPSGLRPETFLMSRKRRGEIEAAKAVFNWDKGQITLGKVPQQHTDELPAGSQDMVSFMYQLSLAPPAPGRIRLPITNGINLEIYQLDVLPEENIETALGTLRVLPIRQVRRQGEESIEIWLSVEYRYLPVRIRFINRDGDQSGEQLVSNISVSEE